MQNYLYLCTKFGKNDETRNPIVWFGILGGSDELP